MRSKYWALIESYCQGQGISIPKGFGRNSPSRYAIIRLDSNPPELVALTWFKMEDVVYYLRNIWANRPVRILDFKEGVELVDEGGKRLKRGRSLDET